MRKTWFARLLTLLIIIGPGLVIMVGDNDGGGMRQRVGFARALMVEPLLLFMDEPFSVLDVLTAANLRKELLGLWQAHTHVSLLHKIVHELEAEPGHTLPEEHFFGLRGPPTKRTTLSLKNTADPSLKSTGSARFCCR